MSVLIRPMVNADITLVTEAACEFFAESDWQGRATLRKDKYAKLLEQYCGHPYVKSILAFVDNALAGYIHIYCQDDYTEELIGELYQFYVRKPYRGTKVARLLSQAADEQYKAWGCLRGYVEEAHGGSGRMMSSKLFNNLWSKVGFRPMGTVLMKEY